MVTNVIYHILCLWGTRVSHSFVIKNTIEQMIELQSLIWCEFYKWNPTPNVTTRWEHIPSIWKLERTITIRNPSFFYQEFWSKKTPHMVFFPPMFNLAKVPFWTIQFGPDHFDWVFLVSLFYRVFFTEPPWQ